MAVVTEKKGFALMEFCRTGEPLKLRRMLHTIITVSSICILLYGSICSLIAMYNPRYASLEYMKHGYEYSPYFLSLWIVGYNLIYYQLYTAIDIVEVYYNNNKALLKVTDKIHKVASYLLFTIIFPMSLYVMLAFWSMFIWDREAMYPTAIDEFLPPLINHCMHTFPLPLSLLYMFTSNRHEPSKTYTISGMVAFLANYWGLFLSIRWFKGKWVYMVLYKMSSVQIFMVISSSLIGPILFLLLGYKVNSTIKALRAQILPVLSSS